MIFNWFLFNDWFYSWFSFNTFFLTSNWLITITSTNIMFIFLIKFLIITSFLILVRGGTPRYRYDYLTKLGWLKFLTLTLSLFFFILLFIFFY